MVDLAGIPISLTIRVRMLGSIGGNAQRNYKLDPIRRKVQELLGVSPREKFAIRDLDRDVVGDHTRRDTSSKKIAGTGGSNTVIRWLMMCR